MKKPSFGGRAFSETLYGNVGTVDQNITKPARPRNFFGLPSLGNHQRDARNLAILLRNLQSGLDAFCMAFDGLEARYGESFKAEFLREVHK